ncbi:MAG TPA: AraC family transcriptional regulator [Gemmataceae bacterium]|nr:AraC family transcriptional regulator [Gemmataceae bacterium]
MIAMDRSECPATTGRYATINAGPENEARRSCIEVQSKALTREKPCEDERTGGETSPDQQFCWAGGSVLLKSYPAQSNSRHRFTREDFAIGIVLASDSGRAASWEIESDIGQSKAKIVTSGELLVIPPGIEFEAFCHGGQALWIFVTPRVVGDQVSLLAEGVRIDDSWSNDRLLCAIIMEIRKECAQDFPRGSIFLENSVSLFVAQLVHVLGRARPRFKPASLSRCKFEMVINHLERNLHRNIVLSELSDLVGLTPRYLCSAFKKTTGRSPHQFQIERRVERAKALLSNPDLSLVDLALMLGFSSQSHLGEYFRRIQGVTPARYRAEILVAQAYGGRDRD